MIIIKIIKIKLKQKTLINRVNFNYKYHDVSKFN